MAFLLAGDVGGTKTLVGLFDATKRPPAPTDIARFATLDYDGLTEVVETFLAGRGHGIEAACFGVAGPVRGQIADLTNVPWRIEAATLADRFDIPRVRLLNDVTAMAHAIPTLAEDQLDILHPGDPPVDGNAALIAPGTGLGEAVLHNVEGQLVPAASEAGHADFAARTPRELELVRSLTAQFGRVSYETVLSGPGLVHLHRFVHESGSCAAVPSSTPTANRPPLIAAAGISGECEGCVETIDIFVSALGAEAGNLGLRAVATAGVYIGGGIPPQILPALRRPVFLDAFLSKAPMQRVVETMPVAVILAPDAALLGPIAAQYECQTLLVAS
jgi:glucokinase